MWFRFSLRFQLLLILATALGAEAGLSSLWGVRVVPRTLENAARSQAESAMDGVVDQLLRRCTSNPTAECALPILQEAKAAGLTEVQLSPWRGKWGSSERASVRRRIGADQELTATVDLKASHEAAGRIIQFQLANLVLAILVGLLLGTVLLNRAIADPVEHLAAVAERIEHLDLAFPDHQDAPMLGKLGSAFERMSRKLREEQARTAKQIFDLTRVNQELKEVRDSLIRQEKLATVGRLAAGVAHEVGNPLGGILGYSELLKAGGDPTVQDYADRIAREVGRIDGIVRGLLDFSRPRDISLMALALGPAVQGALELCKADRRLKDVQITCEIPSALPMVWADEHRLRQLLVNLLLNAADAVMGKGSIWLKGEEIGPEPRLRRRASDPPTAPRIRICVADSGPGIPEEVLPRIFDPFFTTKDVGQGTGLGLSICAGIMEGFGGDLHAENRPEGGAQFVATFRIAKVDTPMDTQIHQPRRP